MELIDQGEKETPETYLKHVWEVFERNHMDDLRTLTLIHTIEHLKENSTTSLYRSQKYKIPLNQHIAGDLFHFLEREDSQGGNVIRSILGRFCEIQAIQRGPISEFSFEAIFRRSQGKALDDIDMQEGIPGHITNVMSNKEILSTPLKLGPLPMEEALREDVRAELLEVDERNPPQGGRASLVSEFDCKIKLEDEAEDAPSRADLPLPPSRVRDVITEMQKVRENRDRFKIDGGASGSAAQISCCIFTLHNTAGS
jgi:transcription initiation factor TFIID subunit 5